MERQLATALAGLTTGIYVLTVRAGGRQHGMSSSWAALDCRLVSTHAAGDHTLFVGEVVEARVRGTDRPLTSQDLPYVYLGGKVLFDQASRRPLGPEGQDKMD